MKSKLIMVATYVAISSLIPHCARAQELTKEQQMAEQARQDEAMLQMKMAEEQSAQRLSKLTPEQLALRKEVLERIKNAPLPPMPTNDPSKKLRDLTLTSAKSATPAMLAAQTPLTRGDYMAMRMALVNQIASQTEDMAAANEFNQMLATNDPVTLNLFNLGGGYDLIAGNTNMTIYSITAADYYPYNTYSFNSIYWNSPNTQGYKPWFTTSRTLVPTNGPAARSALSLPAGWRSELATTVYNSYDYWGDPADYHTLGFWYRAYNFIGTDYFEVQVGPGGAFWKTNLNSSSAWKNVQAVIPKIPAATPSLKWAAVAYSQSGSTINAELDPSVRWIPQPLYYPLNEDFAVERVGNQMWVQWNVPIYRTNYWYLTFAANIAGPWSSSIGVPVTYQNGVATAKFNIVSGEAQRFYRLKHY